VRSGGPLLLLLLAILLIMLWLLLLLLCLLCLLRLRLLWLVLPTTYTDTVGAHAFQSTSARAFRTSYI